MVKNKWAPFNEKPRLTETKVPDIFMFLSHTQYSSHIYIVYDVMFYCRLSQLDQLKVLDISGNSALGAVPEGVYNLTQLTELRMPMCGITEISDRYVRVSYTVR